MFPMDMPAAIHRRGSSEAERIVASGPLVIMLHGLLALHPADRAGCWISTAFGDLTPDQAARTLDGWSPRH